MGMPDEPYYTLIVETYYESGSGLHGDIHVRCVEGQQFRGPYGGGRVEHFSLVPLGEARLGRIGFDEWLRRSQAAA
jgi:hypothetical protein